MLEHFLLERPSKVWRKHTRHNAYATHKDLGLSLALPSLPRCKMKRTEPNTNTLGFVE